MDWSLFHAINSAVATHDSIEDPVTLLDAIAVALYAAASVALWFVARPYGDPKWKLAWASGLAAAAVAMITNQVISHVWERPRVRDASGVHTPPLGALPRSVLSE